MSKGGQGHRQTTLTTAGHVAQKGSSAEGLAPAPWRSGVRHSEQTPASTRAQVCAHVFTSSHTHLLPQLHSEHTGLYTCTQNPRARVLPGHLDPRSEAASMLASPSPARVPKAAALEGAVSCFPG